VTKPKYLIHFNNGEIIGVDDSNCLEHFGILGMKWGHRRTPQELSKAANERFTKNYKRTGNIDSDAYKAYDKRAYRIGGPFGAYSSGSNTNIAKGVDVKKLNPKNKKLIKRILKERIDINKKHSFTSTVSEYAKANAIRAIPALTAVTVKGGPIGLGVGLAALAGLTVGSAGINKLARMRSNKKMQKALKDLEK